MSSRRLRWLAGYACGTAIALAGPVSASEPFKVMSLDQCADQYVMALRPDAEVRLSPRADDADSFLSAKAKDFKRIRPTLEAAVSFKPDVVVRYWGGDARLLSRLEVDGVEVVTIDDSQDFQGIRDNIQRVSHTLRVPDRGEAMIQEMDGKLEAASGKGQGRPATYLTASGFTAGNNTLIDSILKAAGFTNGTNFEGYGPIGLEKLVMWPPVLFVRGFFEQITADWRGTGRHPVLKSVMQERTVADLPASTLTCPAWFAADAALDLADGAH